MSRILPALAILFLVGCAASAPPANQAAGSTASYITTQRSDAAKLRENISGAQTRRAAARLQTEIDALEEEIRALEARLADVEKRIANVEGRQYVPTQTYSGSGTGTVHTGPRGGQYTISPSGNKVYQKRR